MKIKRKLDIVVLSNVHLGTKKRDAKKLLNYLNSIAPKHLVLNGDIIDFSQIGHKHFPKSHLKIVKKLMKFSSNGTAITYVIGNRDKQLEKFVGKQIGNISIVNKLLLDLDGKKTWFVPNKILDTSLKQTKWINKFGSLSFDLLFLINKLNRLYIKLYGKTKHLKLEKLIAPNPNPHIEKIITNHAIAKDYDYVISKLSMQPEIIQKTNEKGSTLYMNTGEWSEHFTALEYRLKRWKLYRYSKDKLIPFVLDEDLEDISINDFIAAITIVKSPEEEE